MIRLGDAGEFERSRHDILKIDGRVTLLAGGNSRTEHDKRHTHAVIVHVLLAEQTVMAEGQAMISRKEDVGVSAQRGLL